MYMRNKKVKISKKSRFERKMEEYQQLEENLENMSLEELEALIPKLKKSASFGIVGGMFLLSVCMVLLFTIKW